MNMITPTVKSMKCRIEIRSVYGNKLAYPDNGIAETFCEMVGRKTLTRSDLECIQALGFTIVSYANADWSMIR